MKPFRMELQRVGDGTGKERNREERELFLSWNCIYSKRNLTTIISSGCEIMGDGNGKHVGGKTLYIFLSRVVNSNSGSFNVLQLTVFNAQLTYYNSFFFSYGIMWRLVL